MKIKPAGSRLQAPSYTSQRQRQWQCLKSPTVFVFVFFGRPIRRAIWLWLLRPMVPFSGRCTTHFRTYFSVELEVHWGYRLFTHGHMAVVVKKRYPKWAALVNEKQGLKPGVPCWSNFDPCPYGSVGNYCNQHFPRTQDGNSSYTNNQQQG